MNNNDYNRQEPVHNPTFKKDSIVLTEENNKLMIKLNCVL